MLDILAIKADVYQLERQGKHLPVYRITLPFDADADRYLGNAEYVMQKENVTVLFCEDTDMPEDE